MALNIKPRILIPWCLAGTMLFLLLGNVQAQEEEEEEPAGEQLVVGDRPKLKAGELTSDFRLVGAMDGATWWASANSISNLVTIEPEEGGEPAGRTIVKVLANQSDIVVGVRCFDDEPNGIVSFSKARDSELAEEDHVVIVLDTFLDGRSGYVFAVNPDGARFDALVIERGEDVNSNWDTIWEAKTSRDNTGWYAEIKIPIKSIGYKKGLTEWGFNVQRRVQRLQETSRWASAKRDFEVYQTSRAGLLTNLPAFHFGMGLSVRPSLVGRGTKEAEASSEYNGDLSLDVTQRLGANLLSALTVNTDFAETEVDVRQINLTRFPVFFPEKRSFFLQGADIFEFGSALDEDTFIPFYSRRIGLVGKGEDNLKEVPINAGGKINGRAGNTNIGALVANTRQIDSLDVGDVDETINLHVPQTTMGSVRLSQNILEESSIGVLANFGDQLGRADSWMTGADFIYRTSNFMNEKNFQISAWGLRANREDLEGDKSAYGMRIDYPNDLLDLNFTTMRLGDGFSPSLSFVPRNDFHLWDFSGEYRPRPNWEWLRLMIYDVSFRLYNERDNSAWQSYEGTLIPFDWQLESGERLTAGFTPQGDRPPDAFEIAAGTDIPSGSYEWKRGFVSGRAAEKRRISGELRYEFGDYYNGNLNTVEARLAIKPSALFTLELTAERNTGTVMALPEDVSEDEVVELVQKDFKEELVGAQVLLNFSSDLQFSSLTQYDTQSKELGTNNRLRWTYDPLGELFLVYNHNVIRRTDENRWEFVSSAFPVKVQYTWRF